ncbi:serine-rich adhesin for platelets-like isoform X2 [Ptychodera flava]
MTVDNWLKKRTSHYIGPIEIRMLLDHMTVSQLLTAIREDQLPITVIIDGALSKVKNVMIKKPLTPPCYEEAVKRSKLFKRHQGFNALKPHIRREVSSSTSSMSTTLPDTPTSATDSHDSSSVNSTDSTLDPFRYRHRRRIGDPRVDIYKAIMNNIRRGRCLPPEKKMHDQRMQAGKSRNIRANPPHLDYSILDKSDKETEESEERNTDVLSPSLPLHTEPTTSTPVVISMMTEDAEGSGSSYSSENKESDTLSDLTSSTSSGSYADKLMQPTTLDMLGRYQSASEPDTEAEEGLSISEHSSMSEEKWSKPGCGSENEVTVKYTPPSEKRKRSPVKIFGVFCSPKSPEKANRRSPQAVPEVDRETSEVHGNRNATSGRTSTEDNLPDVIQFPCNSSFPVVEAEREQQYNDLNRASDKTTSNKLKPDYNLDQSDTENNKSQDKTDCSGTFNTHSIKTSGSAMKLKAVSPEISINVTATDDIWNAHCPHSSDSEDSLSISDSSPNVTLDRLMKHLANSPGKGNAEKARPPSPIYVNINFASVQQSAHDVSGMKTGHTADMQKSDGASTVLVHRNGKTNHTETLKDSGQVRAQDSQTRPVSSTSQFSVSSSGSDTATSSSTHKMHITSPEILGQNGVPSASSSFMEYVKSAVKDTDADNNSTTSSSSADTVVDMSLEYLGKLSSTPNLPSQKASSLDCLTLQDIFDQSEYQAFVNHIRRKQTQKNSTISPLPMKKKLVLPHRNRRKVYSAKLKDSANTTLKQKSASTSSLLDQLKKLTSFEDDEEITVDGSHDQESCVIDKTRTQELQTVMSNHVSGTHGRYFPKDSPSEMNSNKLPNSMEKNNNVDKIDYNQKWESRKHFKSHASMANFSPQSTRSHSIIGKHSAVREYTPIVSDRNHTETPSRDKLSRRLPPTSIHPRSAPSTPRLSHVNTPIFPSGRPVKASVNDSISRNAQHEFRRQELTSQASRQSQQRPLRVQRFGTGVFGLITSPTKKS